MSQYSINRGPAGGAGGAQRGGGVAGSQGAAPAATKLHGVTSPISLAGPTPTDLRLSEQLETTLHALNMYETDEEMAKR